MSDTPIDDDPFDLIDVNNLEGWTHCNDSSRMRKGDSPKRLDDDQHSNSWLRFDNRR